MFFALLIVTSIPESIYDLAIFVPYAEGYIQ
jgi:hypothetical protein